MKTEVQKAALKRYNKSPKGKAAYSKYAKTTKFKEQQKAYRESPKGKFSNHKQRAKRRGIDFEFTFAEWWRMWEPHWEARSATKGCLVMCRHGDIGPYATDNCFIDLHETNARDGMIKVWADRKGD